MRMVRQASALSALVKARVTALLALRVKQRYAFSLQNKD